MKIIFNFDVSTHRNDLEDIVWNVDAVSDKKDMMEHIA